MTHSLATPAPTASAYQTAEAARLALAAEVTTLKATLRRERALTAHPILATGDVLDLVVASTDDEYAKLAEKLAAAITAARAV